jgi:methylated-DNA-protein-cysteine methyltransferase-like protein
VTRYVAIHALTRQIPPGEVATYGQIAFVAELSTPRIVGYAMASLPAGSDVPWHRVLNSSGRVSPRREGDADHRQRERLRGEGVLFDRRGRVDFRRVGWRGPPWEWLEANGYDVGALIWRSESLVRKGAWSRWGL